MLHFFPRFSRNAENSPYDRDLRETGVEHRIFGNTSRQEYRHRWQLALIGYPRLAWTTLGCALRSLFGHGGVAPDAVVLSSDVEVLVFALVRLLPFAARPRIVFIPFIFTERSSPRLNRMRLAYYRFVMRRVSCAICHSALEIGRYQQLFAGCGVEFVFVPWGGHMPSPAEILGWTGPLPPPGDVPVLVAAGRSGRDYPTLVAALAGLACRLVIICNEIDGLGGIAASQNVEILTDCLGAAYMARLLAADIAVVPLRVADISAGQMVLIQAMALARPLVVTDTPTVRDYLQDGVTAMLVPQGDVAAMRGAISRLLDDPAAAAGLGARARAQYLERFSGPGQVKQTVQAVLRHCGLPESG